MADEAMSPDSEVLRRKNAVDAARGAKTIKVTGKFVDPSPQETKFSNLPVSDYGNVKANRERWAAAEELAAGIADKRSRIDPATGMYYPGQGSTWQEDEIRINEARKRLEEANSRVATWSSRMRRPLDSYPTLAKAMAQAPELTEADVARVVNFAAAWTAADAIADTQNVTAQANILLALPPNQRAIVLDILDEQNAELNKAAEQERAKIEADQRDRETWSPVRMAVQGTGEAIGEGLLNIVTGTYQGISQYARAVNYSYNNTTGNPINALVWDPFFNWDKVGKGAKDERVINEAREKFGDVPVDLLLELQQLKDEGDPFPISTVSAKYYNDPERAPIIRALTQRAFDDPEQEAFAKKMLGLADDLATASLDDLGAMLTTTNPLSGKPISIDNSWRGSTAQQAASVATNVIQTFALDPFIVGNKVRGIYLGAKYGLERLALDAGEQTAINVLAKPRVYAYLTDLTKDLRRYREIKDAGGDPSKFMASVTKRYANYFPEDVLVEMAARGVTTPELLVQYVDDTNRMLRIERGQGIIDAVPYESVRGLLNRQLAEATTAEEIAAVTQRAQRAAMAGASTPEAAAAAMKAIDRAVASAEDASLFGRMARQQAAKRGTPLVPRNSVAGVTTARRALSRAISKVGENSSSRNLVRAFYEDANNPNITAGAMLFGDPSRVVAFDRRVSGAWDKLTRQLSVTPGAQAIYTADARDTKVFYKFARMFVSKSHAQYLAEQWRTGDQAKRVLMWVGIVRSAAQKRGYEEIADRTVHLGSRMINNKTQITVGELADSLQFATNPLNRFSPASAMIRDGDGALNPIDDWVQAQADTWVTESRLAGFDPTPEQIAAYRAGLLNNPEARAVIDDSLMSTPSDFNGQQLALHLWQTSDYLHVPNLSDLALITKRAKITNQVLGLTPDSFGNNLVNWWSLLNLVGFRYAVRNAIEDYTMYALTGGYLMDVVQGRAMSTATREARGQNIGFFARRMRKASGEAGPGGETYSVWQNVILPQLNREEVIAANEAMKAGDLAAMRQLMTTAAVRQKLGRTLDDTELRYVSEYVASDESFIALDDLVELAQHLNLGTMPGAGIARGMRLADGDVVYPRGAFESVEVTASSQASIQFWHRAIDGVLRGDGPIGTAAVANLDNPDVAIRAVAEAIEADTRFGYRAKLAAFYEANVTTEEFARRYVQDVLNMFSRKDGTLNLDLWGRVVTGSRKDRQVRWIVDGETVLTPASLKGVGTNNMPRYVLGLGVDAEPIVIPAGVSEKIWNSMGNAFARIAKEPIYFANYLRARKGLARYEANLAESVGEQAAGVAASKIAQDRALALSLQYTDNPANQSLLAWKMRNFARYYRATEDFYRRMYRMAKYDPIGYYKGWLALNLLDDVGFVYEDNSYNDADPNANSGNLLADVTERARYQVNRFKGMYFIYPGSDTINNLMGRVMSMGGSQFDGVYTSTVPLVFGGKVAMLAPSWDPNAVMPVLGSALASLSVKSVVALVPQFQEYEKYLLGPYAAGQDAVQSATPAVVARGLAALSREEVGSTYASAYMSAAKIAEGAGLLPDPETGTEAEWGQAQAGLAGLADQIVKIRFGMGFIATASPQIMDNDVSALAREYGAANMTTIYRGLVEKALENGSKDPYSDALMMGVSIYGLKFTAYGTGKSGPGKDSKKLLEVSYSGKTVQFAKDNEQLLDDHPTAGMWLAPVRKDGDSFSQDTYQWLQDQGYKTPPRITDFMERLRMAEARYVYGVSMEDADAYVANARTDDERKRALEAKRLTKVKVYATYPDLKGEFLESALSTQDEADKMLNSPTDGVRSMIQDFYDGKYGETVPDSVRYIAEAVATYDAFTSASGQITGSTNAEDATKRENKARLIANLQAIAADDDNAASFIRRVIYPLLDVRPDGSPKN